MSSKRRRSISQYRTMRMGSLYSCDWLMSKKKEDSMPQQRTVVVSTMSLVSWQSLPGSTQLDMMSSFDLWYAIGCRADELLLLRE